MTASIHDRIQRLALQGAELGRKLERGQGASPTARQFESIAADGQSSSLSLVLCALDREAGRAALEFLCDGGATRQLSVGLPATSGVVELRFSAAGYSLEIPGQKAKCFDAMESLVAAVSGLREDAGPSLSAILEPLRLRLDGEKGTHDASIWWVDGLRRSEEVGRLIGRARSQTVILCVAGSPELRLTPDERDILIELTEVFEVVLPLVGPVVETQHGAALEASRRKRRGFWREPALLRSRFVLPVKWLDASDERQPKAEASGALNPGLIAAASALLAARRLRSAALMVLTELNEEKLAIASRVRSLGRTIEHAEVIARMDYRDALENLRRSSAVLMQSMSDNITESIRGASLPNGALSVAATRAAENVTTDVLSTEIIPGSGAMRIVIAPSVAEGAVSALERALEQLAREIFKSVDAARLRLEREVASRIGEIRGETSILHLPPPDVDSIRTRMREVLEVRLEASAELERRSFWSRLAKGRQMVFTVLMSVSLFGGVLGVGRQDLLMPSVLLPMFAVGLAMTSRTFARQDQERLRKEVERLSSQLRQQLVRIGADALRDLQDRLRKHLEGWRDQVHRVSDGAVRDAQDRAQRRLAARREEAQSRFAASKKRTEFLDGNMRHGEELRDACLKLEHDAGLLMATFVSGRLQ